MYLNFFALNLLWKKKYKINCPDTLFNPGRNVGRSGFEKGKKGIKVTIKTIKIRIRFWKLFVSHLPLVRNVYIYIYTLRVKCRKYMVQVSLRDAYPLELNFCVYSCNGVAASDGWHLSGARDWLLLARASRD